MQRPSGTLVAANITKHHAAQLVLSDVTLVVPAGTRIGLVAHATKVSRLVSVHNDYLVHVP